MKTDNLPESTNIEDRREEPARKKPLTLREMAEQAKNRVPADQAPVEPAPDLSREAGLNDVGKS